MPPSVTGGEEVMQKWCDIDRRRARGYDPGKVEGEVPAIVTRDSTNTVSVVSPGESGPIPKGPS